MNYNYLVIGSNSFAGSNFTKTLIASGKKVITVSRSKETDRFFLLYEKNINYKFYKIDINKDYKKIIFLIKKYQINYIINFSAQGMVNESWLKPQDWYTTNFLSQIKLIELLKNIKSIKKFIHFTTPEVYGSNKKWIKENSYFNPSTPYAVSRAALDMHLQILFKEKKFPVIFTRAANIYGPGQQIFRLIPKLIYCALTNTFFKIHGSGKSFRSFVYMDDVSQVLIKILNKGKLGKTYHISTKKIYSIIQISKIVQKVIKKKIKIRFINERLGKDTYYKIDPAFSNKSLNWKCKISIERGIHLTYLWLKNNFKKIKKKHLNYRHKK